MPASFPRSVALTPYTLEQGSPVRALEVHVSKASAGKLSVQYVLDAELARLRIPPQRASERRDELWKHTCFEAFIRPRGAERYSELNVSPATEWAAYSFVGYRKGMAPLALAQPPSIRVQQSAERLQLDVQVELPELPLPGDIAFAAVIEDENGRLSYWALKHAGTKPDFHHPDSFVFEL